MACAVFPVRSHTRPSASPRVATLLALLASAWLAGTPAPAAAQSLSNPALVNSSSPNELDAGSQTSYDRQSSVAVQSSSSTSFAVRYVSSASTDAGAFGGSRTETMNSDYRIDFTVSAPGAYQLAVATALVGDLNVRYDGGLTGGGGDVTAVTGTNTGGSGVVSGSLGLADAGSTGCSGANNCNLAINQSSSAVVFGVSNGAAVSHQLRFVWTSSANTAAASGHEAAARLGLADRDGTNGAGDYPGSPSRTLSNDGHFVTVTLTSLCGNGVIDTGPSYAEQCDQGAANGTAASCCTSACTFQAPGTQCRASAGACDVAESCSGASGACPADGFQNAATTCRAAAGPCDVAESCPGTGASCPADALAPAGTTCRGAAGSCDVAEVCSGSSPSCPADGFASSATVCRPSSGVCDVAESCSGASAVCPSDGFASSATICRAAAGDCDVVESCTGASAACPADGKSSGVCRAAAGPCDLPESCDGVVNSCPGDAFRPTGFVCHASAGSCDPAESCSGSTAGCPADAVLPAGTTCRAPAGVCDVAEVCDGAGAACPVDAVAPAATLCRAAAGVCDVAEVCNGVAAACPPDVLYGSSAGGAFVCRGAAGACDLPESCNGSSSACPGDAVAPSGTTCRAAAGVCDLTEVCDGATSGCPADSFEPSTTVCRAAGGACDQAESCTGDAASCPADGGLPDGDGDGTCDAQDNCPLLANGSQADGDGDGVGDGCDPCTDVAGVGVAKLRLRLAGLVTPPGDDRLSLAATLSAVPASPTIDPVAKGLRLRLVKAGGTLLLDAVIPGGGYSAASKIGWKANAAQTSFRYKNRSPALIGGIHSISLRRSATAGTVKVTVAGKFGSYPVAPGQTPVQATIVIDSPVATTGQCGETALVASQCKLSGTGASLVCKR